MLTLEVQERALNAVPGLCDTIDYAEVQGVLFPRVAVRLNRFVANHEADIRPSAGVHENPDIDGEGGHFDHLPVHGKNSRPGLPCTLKFIFEGSYDLQTSLTQKLVPLLSKIRTKEPAVMVRLAKRSVVLISLRTA